jgi:hypothetical protein
VFKGAWKIAYLVMIPAQSAKMVISKVKENVYLVQKNV